MHRVVWPSQMVNQPRSNCSQLRLEPRSKACTCRISITNEMPVMMSGITMGADTMPVNKVLPRKRLMRARA